MQAPPSNYPGMGSPSNTYQPPSPQYQYQTPSAPPSSFSTTRAHTDYSYLQVPPRSIEQKASVNQSGCLSGFCWTFWIGPIFSLICMQMQNTASGKLGYIKGMGIALVMLGVSLIGFASGYRKNCKADYYSGINVCVGLDDGQLAGVLIFGAFLVLLGVYLRSYAIKKFNGEVAINPAVLL